MIYLGIDFGTSTNLVTRWNTEKGCPELVNMAEYGASSPVFPNIIFYDSPTNKFMGNSAINKGKAYPENCFKEIKRRLEEGGFHQYIPSLDADLNAEDIATDIFSYIKSTVEKKYGGEKIGGVVVSVPFAFQQKERAKIQKAAERAGLTVLGLIEEPVAAALSFGLAAKAERGKRQKILMFDLGGGTFDVTVIEFVKQTDTRFNIEVLTTDGDKKLGGIDIDRIIVHKLIEKIKKEFPNYDPDNMSNKERNIEYLELEKAALEVKLSISSDGECDLFYTSKVDDDINLDVIIEEDEFNQWLEQSGFMAKIQDVLDNTFLDLEMCEEPIYKEDIDRIMMVGGTSNIPLISEFVKEYFNKAPEKIKKPDEMVGEGAGIYCGICLDKKIKYSITRRLSYAIGIISKGSFKELLLRNERYGEESDVEYITIKNREKEQSIIVCQKDHKTVIGRIVLSSVLLKRLHLNVIGLRLTTNNNGDVEYVLYDVTDNNELMELIHEKLEVEE